MTTYTKYTLSTTMHNPSELPAEIQAELNTKMEQFMPIMDAKLLEMMAEGKTDGIKIIISPTQAKRVWIDQAAAEEFVNFSSATRSLCNLVGGAIEIFDNV